MGNCKYCRANCTAAKIDREVFCLGYDPAKTHGDRIRNMNDEELAEFLAQARAVLTPVRMEDKTYKQKDVGKWLDWLREEAET